MTRLNGSYRQQIVFSLIFATASFHSALAADAQDRAAWMKEARWGVMTHYLADWIARRENMKMSIAEWNSLVDHFDVEGLAKQIESVGAGYYLITIGQNSGYYLSPNATYDRYVGIQPSKCSRRDLVADLCEALHKRGIKLMVYLPAGAPGGDPVARKALEWQQGAHRNREFHLKWEQVIREWSLRWGKKVVGWWFDGCYWPNTMYRSPEPPNFASFAAAARAGNPDSVVAFNPGVVDRALSITPYEDYTAGEINELDRAMIRRAVNGIVDGAQVHFLSFLGQTWGTGSPRFTTEQAVAHSRKIAGSGGVITWDAPIQRSGLISQPFIDQLTAVGKALARPPEIGREFKRSEPRSGEQWTHSAKEAHVSGQMPARRGSRREQI
jgi:hypothetical protein